MRTPRSETTGGRQEAGPEAQITALRESAFAREVFTPLGGIVEIGAVVATDTWTVADAAVGGLVSARRGEAERGPARRGRKRAPYDVFWAAPETRAVWAELPERALEAIADRDAERLELERSWVAPQLREKMTAPVYSVADRFASWERVVCRMEPGWSSEAFYPISAYDNDLESRDALEELMRALPAELREGVLGRLLARLDARFRAASTPDPERSLRPWVRPTKEKPEAELGEWWKRKPVREPWD